MRSLGDYPRLVAELDAAKNGQIVPETITAGSNHELFWRCRAGSDHAWRAKVTVRTHGVGCPFCAGKRVSVTNRLATVAPAIAAQWHPTKNGALEPTSVVAGSNRRVWWRCEAGPDHEWQTTVNRRTQGKGCPFCSGQRVSITSSLAAQAPEIAREWHPTKNGALRPGDVTTGSSRWVWWRCERGVDHEWACVVNKRVRSGHGCPFCSGRRVSVTSSLAAARPLVAREWHPIKNGTLTPYDVTPGSDRPVWWKCKKDRHHVWQTPISVRTKARNPSGCPFCAGRRILRKTSLGALAPKIARQWHPTKNGALTPYEVALHAKRTVWWKCPRGTDHEWQAAIYTRTCAASKGSCPFCINKRLSKTNALATRFPKVAAEWHPTKNGKLLPADVIATSTQRAFWHCWAGHEWSMPIRHRTLTGSGCPLCRVRKRPVATTGRTRRRVHLAKYESARHSAGRRVG